MKNKIELDLHAETHRRASDCTCYECMAKETTEFIKAKENVLVQQGNNREEDNSKTGRVS